MCIFLSRQIFEKLIIGVLYGLQLCSMIDISLMDLEIMTSKLKLYTALQAAFACFATQQNDVLLSWSFDNENVFSTKSIFRFDALGNVFDGYAVVGYVLTTSSLLKALLQHWTDQLGNIFVEISLFVQLALKN